MFHCLRYSFLIAAIFSLLAPLKAQQPDLLGSWQRAFPLGEIPDSLLAYALADTTRSELLQRLDSADFQQGLFRISYAQNDLRLPVILDGFIPDGTSPFSSTMAIDVDKMMGIRFNNPYRDHLNFGHARHNAVNNYSLHNLNSVSMFRSGKYDLPTQRRQIERLRLTGTEQVDNSIGLQLGTEMLDIERVTFHADKWHRRGTTSLQMSQTAFSDNWYQGGDNNLTISTDDKLVFSRYDEEMLTTFDLTFELKLSGYYTKADTINPMRVNNNQFRVDLSYGYKAWHNWYYSTSAYVKTPIFDYHAANSHVVKNTFLSPLEVNVSVGMDLKLNKSKRYQYSLLLAPLSYNLKYVNDHRVSVTSYGIDANRRAKNQFGATITSKLEWKISDVVSLSNRTYYFTSYHNVQAEFENTINVVLGRYCSAKLYMYPRFDDSRDDEVQMKEMLTFGLSFVW